MNKDATGLLYDLFASLLEYPTPTTRHQAEECLAQLRISHQQAAASLAIFSNALTALSLAKMQELYTTTFDMQPVCYPYLGYQLFGESYKRGALMAQLNEAYHAFGYSAGQELPDHLSVALRFLGLDSANREGDFCQALLVEGLMPALEKMLQSFGKQSESPYFGLLSALHLVLVPNPETEFNHA